MDGNIELKYLTDMLSLRNELKAQSEKSENQVVKKSLKKIYKKIERESRKLASQLLGHGYSKKEVSRAILLTSK